MERYRGLAVLTTNLRANLDEAFTRRIGISIDFPHAHAQPTACGSGSGRWQVRPATARLICGSSPRV